jgi:hypothetical protein
MYDEPDYFEELAKQEEREAMGWGYYEATAYDDYYNEQDTYDHYDSRYDY